MATRFTQALANFKIPKEIKNDIIYCQRALRSHIKVHQTIVDQYSNEKEHSVAKQACLNEIENEIYEINCEQQYLLLRVRRIINEFFKTMHREDIGVDRLVMNDYVSRQLVPLIQDKDYICVPTVIRARYTESQLLETYLLSDNLYDINKSPTLSFVPNEIPTPEPPTAPILNAKQVSLLKPISERVLKVEPARIERLPDVIIPDDGKTSLPLEPVATVSSKVKISRMNLRQALSKAAAAINVAPPQPTQVALIPSTKPNKIVTEVKKSHNKPLKSDPSSSEESLDARLPSPPQTEMKTKAEEYNQESFLKLFNLFTQEQLQQMQQRRSKRKRRGVHNNEKADFHYGRIDHMLLSAQATTSKKRKKEFLLSPRVNRALKKKPSSDADRSNSSSPDEKALCNECMQRTGVIIQCKECLGSYHEKCHKDMNIKMILGQCPSCSRIHYNNKLQQEAEKKMSSVALRGQYRELELKLAMEHHRRQKLQEEGKMYKIDMTKLFNIVDAIKSDENDS